MPDKPLDEATLRETRDELLGAIQDQRRVLGVPVPDSRTAEEFLDPILHKVEAEHNEAVGKPEPTPAPKPEPQPQQPGPQWMGQPEHSGQLPDGWSLFENHIGEVSWNLGSNIAHVDPGMSLADKMRHPKEARLHPDDKVALRRFRLLLQIPEWRQGFQRICKMKLNPHQTERMYRRLIEASYRFIPDERSGHAPKIFVGGGK